MFSHLNRSAAVAGAARHRPGGFGRRRRSVTLSGVRTALLVLTLALAGIARGADASPPASAWNREALQTALAYAEQQSSSALLVISGGEVLAEAYWQPSKPGPMYPDVVGQPTADGAPVEDVASVQKSVVSVLVGMAADRDLIDLDAAVSDYLGSGWTRASAAQESAIQVRHLLSMTSGLTPDQEFEAPAGSRWRYNTRVYSRLGDVLEAATGQDIASLTRHWLTDPLGMTDTAWRRRPWVTPDLDANAVGLYTSARDLARLGALMLGHGELQGRRIVSASYVSAVTRPSQPLNPAYGLLWWLNGQPVRGADGTDSGEVLLPMAPSDLYAARGAFGRFLYVVPSLDLVVVRLGAEPEPEFGRTLWAHLMQAAPVPPVCVRCAIPVDYQPTEARAADGRYVSWREHVIDDSSRGPAALSGSDGLVMGDLDGDGFDDIVSVHESDTVYDGRPEGQVRIAWGSSDPDRWALTVLASGPDAAAAEDVTLGDFDGDGDLDVLAACELAHLIYFDNPGAAARKAEWRRVVLPLTRNRGSYIRAFAADFDGDGRPEVAAANKGEQNPDVNTQAEHDVSLYLPPQAPLDGAGWREQVLGTLRIPINAEPVDLDGNGDLDVVAGSRGEGRVLWFENLGGLQFREHAIALQTPPADRSITGFNMDYRDLNGDGRLDIVSTAWPSSIVVLFQPSAVDQPWTWSELGDGAPDMLVSVRLGDIDGDGDDDVFSGGYSRGPRDQDGPLLTVDDPLGRIAWFENPGDGRFPWVRHDVSRRKRGMYDKWLLRDLDGDGDLDAVGTRGNSEPFDGVIWLEQVRSAEPVARFAQARGIDSQPMPLPEAAQAVQNEK